MDSHGKENWLINLQAFLENRLTTPAYISASRAYSSISAPFLLQNTQGLLDGFSLSLQDHPSWVKSAWGVIEGHLKRTYQRVEDVKELLTTTTFSQARNDKESKTYREGKYRALAAVQDLYLAFCVVDATLKSIPFLSPVSVQGEVREAVESVLPSLVCECFPLLAPVSSSSIEGLSVADDGNDRNAPLHEAIEAYRWQFWDLLFAWRGTGSCEISSASSSLLANSFSEGTISSAANHRLEDYIRHTIKVRHEAEAKTAASFSNRATSSYLSSFESTSNHLHSNINGNLPMNGVGENSLANAAAAKLVSSFSALPQGGSIQSNNTGSLMTNGGSAAATGEMIDKRIRSFMHHIFPSRQRGNAYRHRCGYCGAPFDSDAAKNAHYRCHFHSRNALRSEEKAVRLLFPSSSEFIEHVGDYDRSGYFPTVTLTLEEAYKGGAKGGVSIRRRPTKPLSNR